MKNRYGLKNFGERIRAAEMSAYRLDWRIGKGNTIVVKGDYEGGLNIMIRLEKSGWKDVSSDKTKDVITYVSPNGKWKVNIREISSSKDEFKDYGYNVEVTLDIIDLTKPRKAKDKQREIKFILLNNK